MKKIILLLLLVILFMIPGCEFITYSPYAPSVDTTGKLAVSFIDVGQGESIFVEFPDGKTALIDAGEAEYGQTVVSHLRSRGCESIDYLICSHPHSDHIGGMTQVLAAMSVGEVYMPRVSHTSKTYEKLLLALRGLGKQVTPLKAGDSLVVTPEVTVDVLAPVSADYEEMNNNSVVLRITYGDCSFLLTADAEKVSEKEMLAGGKTLQADVLKVGHHGSSSSTHKKFLEAVDPTYAVISCDGNNEYGHPHDKVVKRLEDYGAIIYRTDLHGTVMAITDGSQLEFVTEVE